MKRIQTACLHQTIHFQLKDNVPAEIAQRLVREEEKEYQENLNRRGVPYRIWNGKFCRTAPSASGSPVS